MVARKPIESKVMGSVDEKKQATQGKKDDKIDPFFFQELNHIVYYNQSRGVL